MNERKLELKRRKKSKAVAKTCDILATLPVLRHFWSSVWETEVWEREQSRVGVRLGRVGVRLGEGPGDTEEEAQDGKVGEEEE